MIDTAKLAEDVWEAAASGLMSYEFVHYRTDVIEAIKEVLDKALLESLNESDADP